MENEYRLALDSDEWEPGVQVATQKHVAGPSSDSKSARAASEMIRYIQEYAGFNNKELGDIFGVSRRSIQNWASGSAISEKRRYED